MKLQKLGYKLRNFLNQPRWVAVTCVSFILLSALFNGVLWRLWALHRDEEKRIQDIQLAKASIEHLEVALLQAKDPIFIERQARDRLDLAGEKDLVFVFPTQ